MIKSVNKQKMFEEKEDKLFPFCVSYVTIICSLIYSKAVILSHVLVVDLCNK